MSETITTSADLYRVAGTRAIGILRRPRLLFFPKRSLTKLGLTVQQHFALARLAGTTTSRSGPIRPRLPAPHRNEVVLTHAGGDAEGEDDGQDILSKIYTQAKIKREIKAGSGGDNCFAQVTGLASVNTLCKATLHIAAGMASIGNNVYCKLPEGAIKKPPRLRFGNGGEVFYELGADAADVEKDYITIECLGPLNAKFSIDGFGRTPFLAPLICILPQNQIPETVVEAMRDKVGDDGDRDWHFLLMSAAKRA